MSVSMHRVCVRCGRRGVQQYVRARQDGTPAVMGEAWVCANDRACRVRAASTMTIDEARKSALRDAADAWQTGEWAGAPRSANRVAERLGTAQYVSDWLRTRAELEGTPHRREVMAVHESGPEAWCPACDTPWPCPTATAVQKLGGGS